MTKGRWSEADDKYLEHWYSEVGIPPVQIADDLGRQPQAVRERIRRLTLPPPSNGYCIGRRRYPAGSVRLTQHLQSRSWFPFRGHRTMAEVAETERLTEERRNGRVTGAEAKHLYALLDRADINNPPPEKNPTEPDAA